LFLLIGLIQFSVTSNKYSAISFGEDELGKNFANFSLEY